MINLNLKHFAKEIYLCNKSQKIEKTLKFEKFKNWIKLVKLMIFFVNVYFKIFINYAVK